MKKIAMLAVVIMTAFVAGCGDDKNDAEPEEEQVAAKRATLLYAVNNSSLSSDFKADSVEMNRGIEAAEAGAVLMVYKTDDKSSAGLYEVKKRGGKAEWRRVKGYARDVTNTDPDRLRLVISDFLEIYPGVPRTLMFWGHGTGWEPGTSDHRPRSRSGLSAQPGPETTAFGGEYGEGGLKWMDVTLLADAIPDSRFDLIWFDCCYMGAIEVAYELRGKCDTYVAYPTEIWDRGANYDEILPRICRAEPDVTGAASALFDYYDRRSEPVTVSVMKMAEIEGVAAAARVALLGSAPLYYAADVSNYGRGYAFYDMLQLVEKRTDAADIEALRKAFNRFMVWQRASDRDFNDCEWTAVPLCGLSMHNFNPESNTEKGKYYRTLAWCRSVYGE